MISKTIGFRGLAYFQTNPNERCLFVLDVSPSSLGLCRHTSWTESLDLSSPEIEVNLVENPGNSPTNQVEKEKLLREIDTLGKLLRHMYIFIFISIYIYVCIYIYIQYQHIGFKSVCV